MPLQVKAITLTAPSSDPAIALTETFALDITATEKGGGTVETATFYPQFSTNGTSFSDITGATDITASPTSRVWTGEGAYSFTVTGDTGGTYWVRGYALISREIVPNEPETVELFTDSQQITVNADKTIEVGLGSLSLAGIRPSYVNPEGSFGGYTYTSNPPDGVVCGTIGQFVLLSLASDEYSVQWCAIGDPSSWPTPNTDAARAVQAGKETLNPRLGVITGIVGNPFFGYVLQEQGITRFTYVGGDVVFRIEQFEVSRGCVGYNRFAQVDDTVFFASQIGYHALSGTEVQDIGLGIVDDTYKPSFTTEQNNVAANPNIDCVFFEEHNLCFNYKTQQWSRQSAYEGDVYYPINKTNGSIGRIVYSGTAVELQVGDSGDKQTGIVQTGDADLNEGGRGVVTGVRPIVNGGTAYVRVGFRDLISPTVRTNLVTYSEDRTNDGTGTTGFITANAIASPSGTLTADKFTEAVNSSQTVHWVSIDYDTTKTSPGETLTFSAYLKAAGRNWCQLWMGGLYGRYFDLSSGIIGTVDPALTTPLDSTIKALGNGWYRCSITGITTGISAFRIWPAINDSGTGDSYPGDGVSGVYIWGVQIETGSSVTSYIKTEGGPESEDTMFSLPADINTRTGMVNLRQEGRYHRVEVSAEDDWETIIGADIQFTKTGRA